VHLQAVRSPFPASRLQEVRLMSGEEDSPPSRLLRPKLVCHEAAAWLRPRERKPCTILFQRGTIFAFALEWCFVIFTIIIGREGDARREKKPVGSGPLSKPCKTRKRLQGNEVDKGIGIVRAASSTN